MATDIGAASRRTVTIADGKATYFSIAELENAGLMSISKTPYCIRILGENVLRNSYSGPATDTDVRLVASWRANTKSSSEFPYMPARVLLQDFTGVPVITDLAAMRDAVAATGKDPSIINPIIGADLVADHSVQVDFFASENAMQLNIEREFARNRERYELLKWAQASFKNLGIVPPGVGIVHQVNLEHLATVVSTSNAAGALMAYPDTCIGTDSHTTMINGLGVLGWGVGGIEAEAVMLGQPYYMVAPEVVGVRLVGEIPTGATATDLVLTITEMLRGLGVVEKFVEFYGPALASLPVADRATIANMSPEYGATCGFFPIDEQTLRYLRMSGRSTAAVELTERYAKDNLLWHLANNEAEYSQQVEFNLGSVVPSIAGPRRPQDRIVLKDAAKAFGAAFPDAHNQVTIAPSNGAHGATPAQTDLQQAPITEEMVVGDGSVVIAAITSCTNTSNPSVMVGAGLLAKNAVEAGLTVKPWVKTSMAPGSPVVTRYLEDAGLTRYLERLGFHTVGYGCTTCIGNSGPLPPPVATAVEDNNLSVVAVLSGNRNFEGRVHPQVKANYLASPLLVVAYALLGQMNTSITDEPLGHGTDGSAVYLKDIWPTQQEITAVLNSSVRASMFKEQYANARSGTDMWQQLPASSSSLFPWDAESTYIQKPPYFEDFTISPKHPSSVTGARVLVQLGNTVTTDHISPAGAIPPSGPAGQHLTGADVPRRYFNTFGARRGNHNVMMRGTFGNVRLRNQLTPTQEGDWTRHFPDGQEMRIFDAAMKYQEEGVPLIILAGKEYGTGSSRDWAAKGPMLLGVRAVIAQSYERIHRANLLGMGVLPLQFMDGEGAEALGLTGEETYDVQATGTELTPGTKLQVIAHLNNSAGSSSSQKTFTVVARLDTQIEVDYYHNGGLLLYVLRKMLS